jgi:hypothetical protein
VVPQLAAHYLIHNLPIGFSPEWQRRRRLPRAIDDSLPIGRREPRSRSAWGRLRTGFGSPLPTSGSSLPPAEWSNSPVIREFVTPVQIGPMVDVDEKPGRLFCSLDILESVESLWIEKCRRQWPCSSLVLL